MVRGFIVSEIYIFSFVFRGLCGRVVRVFRGEGIIID